MPLLTQYAQTCVYIGSYEISRTAYGILVNMAHLAGAGFAFMAVLMVARKMGLVER